MVWAMFEPVSASGTGKTLSLLISVWRATSSATMLQRLSPAREVVRDVGQGLAGFMNLTCGDDRVARGHDLADGGEVASPPGQGVAEELEDDAPQHPQQDAGPEAEPGPAAAGHRHDDAEEHTDPKAVHGPRHRCTPPAHAPGDALDLAQVGADDRQVLNREALVRQSVDRPLRLRVGREGGCRVYPESFGKTFSLSGSSDSNV